MIELVIKIADGQVVTSFKEKRCTLNEVSLAMYQLEKAKDYLKMFKFPDKFSIKKQ